MEIVVERNPKKERVMVGVDRNGDIGEGNSWNERVIRKHGFGTRNAEGTVIVEFAQRKDMTVVICFH